METIKELKKKGEIDENEEEKDLDNDEEENENENEKEEDIIESTKSLFKNQSYSKRDIYYRKAKEEGFRARSVYKLKEINDNFDILKGATKIIDLCAAPGSWSQMLRILTKSNPNTKIVSVDIQDIVPIEGINIVKGDITKQSTIEEILSHFNNEKVDCIIFDGAPDVTGNVDIDMYMQVQLIVFSMIICIKVMKKGGKFVAKVFKEDNKTDYYYEKLKPIFSNVHYFKPGSSRNTSNENFVICDDFDLVDEDLKNDIDKMSIEDIFNFEADDDYDNEEENKNDNIKKNIKKEIYIKDSTKKFLRFLIHGEY
jgi:tRNA (cytidine32/guanosine34-2'-O)-methyltransferase